MEQASPFPDDQDRTRGAEVADADSSSPSSPEQPSDRSDYNPPPSIAHLLLVTAAASIYLGVNRSIMRLRSPDDLPLPNWWQSILYVAYAIVSSPAIASLMIAVRRRMRGIAFPHQPGEWLLCLLGTQTVAQTIAMETL